MCQVLSGQMNRDSNNGIELLEIFPVAIQDQIWILLEIVRSIVFSFSVFVRKFQKYKEQRDVLFKKSVEINQCSFKMVFQATVNRPKEEKPLK